ncbi:MAG: AAA family ATPase, partial [Burkholderiales bacterium]
MSPKLPQPLATVPAAQLVKTASPVEWLVEGLLLKSGAAILGGAPKSGKSFFALDLCVAVASGTTGAGYFRVEVPCPATMLCAYDPSPVLAQRLTALARSRSKTLHE